MGKLGQPALNRTCITFISGYYTLLLVCFFVLWPGLLRAETGLTVPQRVLLLNSYHKGYVWTDDITRGVVDTFAGHDIELHVEYMDTKRQFGRLYRTYLYRLLSFKHIKHGYDVVITSDDNAFDFFREYREHIARSSPHIFCGINCLTPDSIAEIPNLTGVNERFKIEGNVDLIRQLHPRTRKVLVITDNTTTGQTVQAEVSRIQKKDWGDLSIELIYDVTIEELGERLRNLETDTKVLFSCFFRDNRHRFFEYDRVAKFVVDQTPGPVYCVWSFSWGFGMTGGYMVDAYGQGTAAAGQALEILKGTPLDKIPVQWNTPIVLRFDYNQLKAHGISLDKLPPGAEIENRPVSVFQKYGALIWNVGLVICVLGLALAGAIYCLIRVRRSERRMEKSQFLHKSLFEKTNDAILILDAPTGRCLDANPAARDITGRPLYELKNMTVRELSPQSEEKWMASDKPGSRAVDLGQVAYVAKDGSERFARASSVSLEDNLVMAIAKDITQDLELEKQLRQAQKMEAIGTLAGGIAHDFNNILSGIYSYSQLAQMNLEGDPEKAMEQMGQVIKGAKRASELVHQILTFSRQAEPHPNYFELSLIVKEAVKFLRSSIPSSIEIREDISSRAGIQADPTQVHQVVMNLGTNAYHAMREAGGVMTVVLDDVELSQQDIPPHYRSAFAGTYVRMVLGDTGHGMDADTMARIFDPYFTTKKPGRGTGMGLSVVDGILRQHGGFIRVESTPGKGSRFEVCWPASEQEVLEAAPSEEEEEVLTGQGNILAVDDEPGILNALKALLGRRGYSVTITNSPIEALARIEKDPGAFDLLITDMTMPKMSGIQLAEKVCAVRSDLPMILCTGYHESVSESEALARGFSRFLEKPVMTGELYKTVADLMNPPSPKET